MRRLAVTLLVALVPIAAQAQGQQQVPWPGVTLPTFVIPASAVNGSGTVTAAQLLCPDGSASVPCYSFWSEATTGMYRSGTGTISFSGAGTRTAFISGTTIAANSLTLDIANQDVIAAREAAGHSFWRNSTTAQRASWANTYTSATNYEAFSVDWQTVANVATIGTRTAATGSSRAVRLVSQDSSASNSYATLQVNTSAPFIRAGYFTSTLTAVNLASTGNLFQIGEFTNTATSGSVVAVAVTPTYNQSSGTAANTDLLINRTETAVGSGSQRLIDAQTGGTSRYYLTAGGATGRGTTETFTQSTAPTCSSNCGTSPSVAGSDTAGRVTMGSSGVPASGWVVTFNGTWANAPVCQVWSSKTGMVVGKMPIVVATSTTTFTVTTNGTAPATTDTYDYRCTGIQ